MASRPYKASHYLQDPQDRAAYLNEVLESGDFDAFLVALTNLAETVETDSATTAAADFRPRDSVKPETANLLSLNTLLHHLGLRLSIDVLKSAANVTDGVANPVPQTRAA